jgi:hypothetical protein
MTVKEDGLVDTDTLLAVRKAAWALDQAIWIIHASTSCDELRIGCLDLPPT